MLPLLYVVFTLSGVAGLIYESIWTRYLGLFVGHSAYAQVIVLVIFLGGMSLGALIVGRRTEALRRPLSWYAMAELAAGLIGLLFHDAFVATTGFAYSTLFPAVGVGVAQVLVKWGLASLLILPQSVLLGMTFPLMSAGVVRRSPADAGKGLAMLYFANSLGAAAGVLLAGFWLVSLAGLPGTLLVAAMINLTVAALVIGAHTRGARGNPDVQQSQNPTAASAAVKVSALPRSQLQRVLLAVSFGTALASFVYEIGWIRMLALVLGSATHSFELMLSAFILGLALGAFWVRRRADAQSHSLGALGVIQLAMGSLAIATLPVYLQTFHWMVTLMAAVGRTPEGYGLFSFARYALCLTIMLPATFCAGMTLPLITRILIGAGVGERSIGQVYGVNTLGSVVGAGLAGLVLMPMMGLKWLLVAGAAVDISLGIWLVGLERRSAGNTAHARHLHRQLFAGAAGVVVVAIALGTTLDHTVLTSAVYRYGTVQSAGSRQVPFYRDGRTATVSVRRLADQGGLLLATNGKPDASLGLEWLATQTGGPAPAQRPFSHDESDQLLPALVGLAYAPGAQEAIVIGQGAGMTSHGLLASPRLHHLVTIEIEPEMINASRMFLPANHRVFDDPRSSFAIDDARSYLASRAQKFDLIVSQPSNPWVSGVSGLFTTEFYGRVAERLTPNGVFAQWLHLSEIDDGLVLGVIAALSQQLPTYTIYQISSRDILIIATARPILPVPDWTIFQWPGVAEDLKRVWPLTARTMETLHIADNRSLDPLVRTAAIPNSDFYPALDLSAERTRFMDSSAEGFADLNAGRVNVAAIIDGRRNGLGDPYAVISGVPRLEAMAIAAGIRTDDARARPGTTLLADKRELLEDQMATSRPPVDWRLWIQSMSAVEAGIHGGMAGVVDSAFYRSVRAYLVRANAPPLVRSSIDFLHGLASWDFTEASGAADPLIAAAAAGVQWVEPDMLCDGAVIAKLALGDRAGARAAFKLLVVQSARPITDLRTRLLYAYVNDSTVTPRISRLR